MRSADLPEDNCISFTYLYAPHGYFVSSPSRPRFALIALVRTSKRGRLIIGLSFSLTLSPARQPPTFHPVLLVCRRTYFSTMVYRDWAIMTMPGVIGCRQAETIWNIVRNASSRIVVPSSVQHGRRIIECLYRWWKMIYRKYKYSKSVIIFKIF